jgi:hypothetical protein
LRILQDVDDLQGIYPLKVFLKDIVEGFQGTDRVGGIARHVKLEDVSLFDGAHGGRVLTDNMDKLDCIGYFYPSGFSGDRPTIHFTKMGDDINQGEAIVQQNFFAAAL